MKERQKKILRFLLSQDQPIRIEDMARTFNVGTRTVSRDLDSLETWLSLHGILLERKPNQGIQIQRFGRELKKIQEIINKPDSYLESLQPETRQKLMLLYLIYHNREIKISEIAYTFYISDTSVWNDMNTLETQYNGKLRIHRQKGVGIHLEGNEKDCRLIFLSILTDLFDPKTIIPYLYTNTDDINETLEGNQFRLLMDRIRFPATNMQIQKWISFIEKEIGYQFTMAGETLLYFYLQLSSHRIKSGSMIRENQDGAFEPLFYQSAENLLQELTGRTLSGTFPAQEVQMLALLLNSLELGEGRPDKRFLPEDEEKLLQKLIESVFNKLGDLDNQIYYLQPEIQRMLICTLKSFMIAKKHQIPHWQHSNDLSSFSDKDFQEKAVIIKEEAHHWLGINLSDRELKYLYLHFHGLVMKQKVASLRRYRCLICCFEGIGLASYLHAMVKKEFEEIDIVKSTAVYKFRQQYIDQNQIDIVLSTYTIKGLDVPVVPITLPLKMKELHIQVRQALVDLSLNPRKAPLDQHYAFKESEKLPFEDLWSFIHRFKMVDLKSIKSVKEVIYQLSQHLLEDKKSRILLEKDLWARETLGPLEFEEYSMRMLHCKSSAIDNPTAGVISFPEDSERYLFLIAPDPCPEAYRLMLSHVTLSFIENSPFREAIRRGSLNQIRKALIEIYKDAFV